MAVFSDLSVKENLILGAREGPLDDARLAWIFGFFPALRKFWLSRAGSLSGGQKQMLSIARAIVEPRELLLIDEPTKGLAPAIVGSLIDCLKEIKATGVTILLVEQNFRVAREVGDEVRVMDNGRIVHRGAMAALAADEAAAEPPARPQPGFAPMSALDVGAALPRRRVEILPALTPLIVALVAAPFIGSPSTFVTLTAAGLAMGMMIFTMASGLTLVFGMMDVLNFGHGAFIALGAYVATLVLLPLASWSSADSVALNLAVFALAVLAAALVCGALGWVFERLIVKPVYGQHLRQILATIGGSIIAEQLLYALFGPDQIPLALPTTLRGLVRVRRGGGREIPGAGDGRRPRRLRGRDADPQPHQDRPPDPRRRREPRDGRGARLSHRPAVRRRVHGGLGARRPRRRDDGALSRSGARGSIGGEFLVLCFIVIIIGGLGSVGGSFVASILVALIANYAGFLAPKLALVSNILAMVVVLLWRPRGLYPVSGR